VATYFIDFATGSNSNAGTSTGAPWKHCPGDTNATGTAAATSLVAGDTVILKGGVHYYGRIGLNFSGADGNRLTYDGNSAGTWGTGKAIIDGSETFSATWTQATSADDVRGNSNYANIWYCTPPAAMTHPLQTLFVNGVPCYTAQHLNPPESRYYMDDPDAGITSAIGDMTLTSQRSTATFTQSDSAYWDDAWLGQWRTNNSWAWVPITGFDTATDTVSYASTGAAPYSDRDSYFTIISHPAHIDTELEYAYCPSEGRLYFWSPGGVDPGTLTMSVGSRAFGMQGTHRRYVTVRDLIFIGQWGESAQAGAAIVFSADPASALCRNNIISGCEAKYIRSMDREWMFKTQGLGYHEVSDCLIEYCYGGAVAQFGSYVTTARCEVNWVNRTAIYFAACHYSTITRCKVYNVRGTHSNGISVYSSGNNPANNTNNVVSYCDLYNILTPITYEYGSNLDFIGNLVDAAGEEQSINEWGGCAGTIRWIGNTIVNRGGGSGGTLRIGNGGADTTYVLINNIIDGGGLGATVPNATRANNIYLSRAWWQDSGTGWELGTDEVDVTDPDTLFVSPATRDWRLKAGSVAIDAGIDPTSYYAVGNDLNDAARPAGAAWDIGAYEYASGPASSVSVPNPLGNRSTGARRFGIF
jgi:hypothetical protein